MNLNHLLESGLVGPLSLFVIVCVICTACTAPYLNNSPSLPATSKNASNLTGVLKPQTEDKPFFEAIAEDQEKKLGTCKNEEECRSVHFLRGLAALYENRELAALHFRKVVASRPNSTLAKESRFWLWFLDVLNSPSQGGMTHHDLIRRLTREIVEKELSIYELTGKLENSSVEALQQELVIRDKSAVALNQTIGSLKKQVEQLKIDQKQRQNLEKELKVRESKVQELTKQLEALRRIDQEIREKAPPTRPSEKMTPTPEVETTGEKEEKTIEKDKQ